MTTVTKEVLGVVDGQWSPRAFWRTATADAVARQLKAGADPRHADRYGLTSLHWAALMDNPDVMPLLVEAGIDIDARDAKGNTALLLAAEKGNLARAAMHAREGMAPVVVGIRTLEMLLQLGAEANVVNKGKWSPLHWAVAWDAPEATDMLLRIGTSINIPGFKKAHPLHIAAMEGSPETVALLIRWGADVNARDDFHATPIHRAIKRSGEAEAVTAMLIRAGAICDLADALGNTPMHYAEAHGHKQVVLGLRAAGAAIDATNNFGVTPGHVAEAPWTVLDADDIPYTEMALGYYEAFVDPLAPRHTPPVSPTPPPLGR